MCCKLRGMLEGVIIISYTLVVELRKLFCLFCLFGVLCKQTAERCAFCAVTTVFMLQKAAHRSSSSTRSSPSHASVVTSGGSPAFGYGSVACAHPMRVCASECPSAQESARRQRPLEMSTRQREV